MATSLRNSVTTFLPLLFMAFCLMGASARAHLDNAKLPGLATRLKLDSKDADSPNCRELVYQLQACSGEVISFFINGETYLGPSCCHAIRAVQHECWPNLLETLGFTTEEGYTLEGYCDGAAAENSPPVPPTSINEPNK